MPHSYSNLVICFEMRIRGFLPDEMEYIFCRQEFLIWCTRQVLYSNIVLFLYFCYISKALAMYREINKHSYLKLFAFCSFHYLYNYFSNIVYNMHAITILEHFHSHFHFHLTHFHFHFMNFGMILSTGMRIENSFN